MRVAMELELVPGPKASVTAGAADAEIQAEPTSPGDDWATTVPTEVATSEAPIETECVSDENESKLTLPCLSFRVQELGFRV